MDSAIVNQEIRYRQFLSPAVASPAPGILISPVQVELEFQDHLGTLSIGGSSPHTSSPVSGIPSLLLQADPADLPQLTYREILNIQVTPLQEQEDFWAASTSNITCEPSFPLT